MNLRQAITRNVTYSKVTLHYEDDDISYIVYGKTTPTKEMKTLLKKYPHIKELPIIEIVELTEQRAISIENFIAHSEIVKKDDINAVKQELNSKYGYIDTDIVKNNESEEL